MKSAKPLFLLVFATLGVQSASAVPMPESPHVRLGFSLYGNSAQSTETQSRIAGAEVEAGFRDELLPDLELKITGGVQIETGASRARWAGDYAPRQIQRLREAQVTWRPGAGFGFTVGAIDQQRWQSPLLLQRQSFPALYEAYELKTGRFTVGIEAQQAVAADTSSLQPFGNWSQGMPAFYFERAKLAYTFDADSKATLFASHYAFHDLASPGAFQSQFFGNTITGTAATDAAYAYAFSGFELGFNVRSRIGHVFPEVQGGWMENPGAPAGKSKGWRLAAGAAWEASNHFRFTPRMELFRMESDVVPGFYNDRVFGHNNRNGFGVSFLAEWPLSGVQAQARWIHAGVLSPHLYQSNLDWVQVQLSTQYDLM